MSPPPTSTSASTTEPPRILDDTPVEVAIIGSGVCGVLAAAALRRRDGARVRVLEASPEGAGGVWRTTANAYSTLQVRRTFPAFFLPPSFCPWKKEGEREGGEGARAGSRGGG